MHERLVFFRVSGRLARDQIYLDPRVSGCDVYLRRYEPVSLGRDFRALRQVGLGDLLND